MPEHRIRLNRAWEIRAVPLDSSLDEFSAHAASPTDERHDLPLVVDHWPVDDEGRPVRLLLTRWFNGPPNLLPGQPVRVVIEPQDIAATVRLNANEIEGRTGETPLLRIDVTDKLQRHNRLDILVGDHACLSSANISLVIEDDGKPLDFDRFAAS